MSDARFFEVGEASVGRETAAHNDLSSTDVEKVRRNSEFKITAIRGHICRLSLVVEDLSVICKAIGQPLP